MQKLLFELQQVDCEYYGGDQKKWRVCSRPMVTTPLTRPELGRESSERQKKLDSVAKTQHFFGLRSTQGIKTTCGGS